ncbi:MAG: carbohydrate kinase family protein [Ignavibacteriaceae bacterium]|nr:carbohydrate kinase family protein [Ignavibacteriaceae bacterium]
MKILLIGQSVEDHINFDRVEHPATPGGIFYSAAAISAIKEEKDEIFLATSIAENNYELFEWIYKDINLSYSTFTAKIPKIHLTVKTGKEREECYNHLTDSLTIDTVNLSSFDAVYINMITGFDISLQTLSDIRKNFIGIIYIDIHSLARGLNDKMERHFIPIPNFSEWAKNVDIVQVNENELLTLSALKDEIEIVKEILALGPSMLIVTYGEKGAALFYKEESEINRIFIKPQKIETVNQVGCGDVLGASFIYQYTKTKDKTDSLDFAVKTSGLVASYDSIKLIRNLKEDVSRSIT